MRSTCFILSLALAWLTAVAFEKSAAAAEKPMNIVFFLVDDFGYMDSQPYNPETFYETPNIQRLAESGLKFTDGYAANPVCSPTRYSIMTGKYPSRIDATNYFSGTREGKFRPAPLHNDMPVAETTIAEALKAKGYHTFFAGKWHLGPSEEFWPTNQGFDVNIGGHSAGGPYGGKKYFSPYGNPKMKDGPAGEHLPDRLATEAAAFIEKHKSEHFFTYISFYSVHTPLIGRPDLVEKYKQKAEKLGLNKLPQFAEEEQVWETKAQRQVRILQNHAVYAAMVEAMDAAVGKVLDKLDELQLTEHTAVFLMSDNGGLSTSEGSPTSNLPLRGGKGWVYEGGIREPYLVRAPGITRPGSVSSEPVMSIDFFPTITELAGLPAQSRQQVDGKSLLPVLRGGDSLGREALYWHYPHYPNQGGFPGGAIRMGDWKLVERYEDGRVHLFNLHDDIGEQHDLAPQNAERVTAMRKKLHEWYKEVDAKFLAAKPGGTEPWSP